MTCRPLPARPVVLLVHSTWLTWLLAWLPGAGAVAWAEPKVCGNQPVLGDFDAAKCLPMRDDGAEPDEVKGDGVYTAWETLAPTTLLRYKILPSGAYDGTEIRQVGPCGPGGESESPFQDILVPAPDVGAKVRFYYDSRPLLTGGYAPAPGNRSGGDSAMIAAPSGRPPSFIAVGDFQDVRFDPASGVDLKPMATGVLAASFTLPRGLAAGWQWKVFEKGRRYDEIGARKFGPDGWSYTTKCDSANVTVDAAVPPGGNVQFVFHAHVGRLQTLISGGFLDSDPGARDLRQGEGGGADLRQPGGGGEDLGAADMAPGDLPGIHCKCQLAGRAQAQAQAGPPGPAVLAALLLLLALLRRRVRSLTRLTYLLIPMPLVMVRFMGRRVRVAHHPNFSGPRSPH